MKDGLTLEALIELANNGIMCPVVLTVNGTVITGTIDKWDEAAAWVSGKFAKAIEAIGARERGLDKKISSCFSDATGLLFLRDASVMQGGNLHSLGDWCISIESVDGFTLGSLKQSV